MRKEQNIKGWVTALAVIGTAAVILPALGAQASSQRAHRPFACQFSFACDGSMDRAPTGKAWQRSQDIAQISLTGFVPDLTKNSTHYHTVEIEPNWSKTLEFKAKIGFHKFYRPSWRERNVGTSAIAIAPPT